MKEQPRISLGKENDASIKEYEKGAAKEASKRNTGVENLFGKGIDKEDVMRVDANIENEARDEIGKWKGSHMEKHAIGRAERIANSDLVFRVFGPGVAGFVGTINGHKVEIRTPIGRDLGSFSGSIDGIELSREEAKKIGDDYYEIAKERSYEIDEKKKEQSRGEDAITQ